jgi:hypothetical protein
VEHRHEDRPPPDLAELDLARAAEHEHDVLREALVGVGDPHPLGALEVLALLPADPRAVSALDDDLAGADPLEAPDEAREEVAALAGLLVHARQPDGKLHRPRR